MKRKHHLLANNEVMPTTVNDQPRGPPLQSTQRLSLSITAESSNSNGESTDVITVVGTSRPPNATALVTHKRDELQNQENDDTCQIYDMHKISRIEDFVQSSTQDDTRGMIEEILNQVETDFSAANYNPHVLLGKIVGMPQMRHVDFQKLNSPYLASSERTERIGNRVILLEDVRGNKVDPINGTGGAKPGEDDTEPIEDPQPTTKPNTLNGDAANVTACEVKTRAKEQAELRAAICHKCNLLDKTRGPRKKDAKALVSKFAEAAQVQDKIRTEILNLGHLLVKETISLEGHERAVWKHEFAKKRGTYLIPNSINCDFVLSGSDTVKGKEENVSTRRGSRTLTTGASAKPTMRVITRC